MIFKVVKLYHFYEKLLNVLHDRNTYRQIDRLPNISDLKQCGKK